MKIAVLHWTVLALVIEMAQTENLCLLSAPHQERLSAVRTASAFVVHYSVRVCAPKVSPPNSNGDLRPLA